MIKGNSFTNVYYQLLQHVFEKYEFVSAPRGMKVKESLGVTFRIENIRDRIPFIVDREFSISYMIAELLWYLSANNSTAWISRYSSFWKNISDDGVTANSAYGARIFKQHPYQSHSLIAQDWTQWDFVKKELKKDPDSRRAVIHIRMPQDSALAEKDVPCTLSLQFFIRDGKLHQVASMRSSDLILGIAYDIPAFTFFQELLAFELGVECGTYTHTSNSLHIYERHFDMVNNILDSKRPFHSFYMTDSFTSQMPAITELPPIDEMLRLESMIVKANTNHELHAVDFEIDNLPTMWRDWMKVLLVHRTRAIAGKDQQPNSFIAAWNHISYGGYKVFKK